MELSWLIHCCDGSWVCGGREEGRTPLGCLVCPNCSRSPLGDKEGGVASHATGCVSKGCCRRRGLAPCPGQGCLCLFRDIAPDLFLSQWLLGNLCPG